MGNLLALPFALHPHGVIVEFWTRMQAGGEPLTLVGSLLMWFDDEGLCTDLRECWQLLPELRDPRPGWGE